MKQELIDWVKAEARKADDAAHDMSDGTTPEADKRRNEAWTRATAFYEMQRKIEGMN